MNLPNSIALQVTRLFKCMDDTYDQVAAKSGFKCMGCEDNCCLTRFYHHTLLELLYFKTGVAALPARQQQRIKQRAHEAIEQMADLERRHQPVRVMCPLNEAERCVLYAQRPMICRLHGIPHTLRRPDGKVQTGPGCDDFYAQCGEDIGIAMERTPLYMQMAKIERELREQLDFNEKIKMTIAEIIINDGFTF